MEKKNRWYKLDNAAKIFPPTTSYYDPKIFRFSCLLKEVVNKENLIKALKETLEDYPIFRSVLKRGLFWYYLEDSDIEPIVLEEKISPCEKLNSPLLFQVTYYKNKINLEVYHALSDGGGCISFFKSLIYNYIVFNYKIKNKEILNNSSDFEKESDSFNKYYNPDEKIKIDNRPKAYQIKGASYPEGKIKVIMGVTSTSKLKELAHKYNTTITGIIGAILIKSIGDIMSIKDKKQEVSLTVPIDLRKHFKSNTVRNFFNVTNINYKFKDNDSLDKIVKSVKKQLEDSLKPEILSKKMNRLIFLENFAIIRLVPLFIKNLVLRFSFYLNQKKQTMGLSNVGIITMPDECEKYIDSFSVINSTDALELCVLSYGDKISLGFTSHFIKPEVEKNFFNYLREYGLDIILYTNNIEGCDINE